MNNCDNILAILKISQHVFLYVRMRKTVFFSIRDKVRNVNITVTSIIHLSMDFFDAFKKMNMKTESNFTAHGKICEQSIICSA